jgi:hypothetical protein
LGSIAAKELAGTPLKTDDYDTIQACLGPLECLLSNPIGFRSPDGSKLEMPPVPVVAAVAGYQDSVLEAAVGSLDRIYVVVPLEGRLQVAQGGVFSYYEFTQPRDNRLTDDQWRKNLAENPPAAPQWASEFVLPGGKPTPDLAFRLGDVYLVTPAGTDLNLRANPSRTAAVLAKIQTGDYLTITDGPVTADGYTWWKVESANTNNQTGWVVQNPAWVERAHGQ